MSKKNITKSKPAKNSKKRWILIAVLTVVVLAVGLGIYQLVTYGDTDQSGWMSEEEKTQYNTALTRQAWLTGRISKNEILLIKTVNKNLGGDTHVELYVYQLPEGGVAKDYLHMDVSQVGADSGLKHVGTASCKLAGDKLESVYSLQVTYMI
jgi:hypothetical protein